MKELKIEIPTGYEIDVENSTFEKIVFNFDIQLEIGIKIFERFYLRVH